MWGAAGAALGSGGDERVDGVKDIAVLSEVDAKDEDSVGATEEVTEEGVPAPAVVGVVEDGNAASAE